MPTYEEAIDFMYSRFRDVWEAEAASVVGYTDMPLAIYEGMPVSQRTPTNEYWARLSVRNALDRQITIGSPGAGQYEYESAGTLTIELYLPKQDNAAITKGRRLAVIVRNAYRGVADGDCVWYFDATVRERAAEERWQRIDVTMTYSFNETY